MKGDGGASEPAAPNPLERAAEVQHMFSRIVPRYDRLNRIMTAGLDGRWRRATALAARPAVPAPDGGRILDLGAGTGDLARALLAAGAREVVCVDFSRPMLAAGRSKLAVPAHSEPAWLLGDALRLPFPDASFDSVASAFLLRNLVDLPAGLAEMQRVLKPGGRLVSLDITPPRRGPRGALLRIGFQRLIAPLAGLLSGDREAYRYLPTSLHGFPDAERLANLYHVAGIEAVGFRRLGAGMMALHWGRTATR